jgi:alkaline phosphatase
MHPTAQFWQSPDLKATNTREKRAMLQLKFEAAEHEQKPAYWRNVAQNILQDQLKKNDLNKNRAKNIIFFMGDGMSVPTLAATRIFMGGEEQQLSFEKFPFVGLSKTYCANTQVADSACSATAYLCGVKGNYGTIGMSAAAQLGNCLDEHNTENHVDSIAKWAQDANMTTGERKDMPLYTVSFILYRYRWKSRVEVSSRVAQSAN